MKRLLLFKQRTADRTGAIGVLTQKFFDLLQTDRCERTLAVVVAEHCLPLFPRAHSCCYVDKVDPLTSQFTVAVLQKGRGAIVPNLVDMSDDALLRSLRDPPTQAAACIIMPVSHVSISGRPPGVLAICARSKRLTSEDVAWAHFAASLIAGYHCMSTRTSLLRRIMPQRVTQQLLENENDRDRGETGGPAYARRHASITVIFADIVGFTAMCDDQDPSVAMNMLHALFCKFDQICRSLLVYKVETIGDSYMVAAGLDGTSDHVSLGLLCAARICQAATETLSPRGAPLHMRAGMHTGPAYSGVIGHDRPRYCLFGDTVNTASRMESTGKADHVHLSSTCFDQLPEAAQNLPWNINHMTPKGKHAMETCIIHHRDLHARACVLSDGSQPPSPPVVAGEAGSSRRSCAF